MIFAVWQVTWEFRLIHWFNEAVYVSTSALIDKSSSIYFSNRSNFLKGTESDRGWYVSSQMINGPGQGIQFELRRQSIFLWPPLTAGKCWKCPTGIMQQNCWIGYYFQIHVLVHLNTLWCMICKMDTLVCGVCGSDTRVWAPLRSKTGSTRVLGELTTTILIVERIPVATFDEPTL